MADGADHSTMQPAPTRGAVDEIQARWVAQPAVARLVRILLFVAPMVVAWIAVRTTKQFYWQPEGTVGILIWAIQAIFVAGLASFAAVHVVRRTLPLTALFQMTLIFPDQAPSRLGIALRGGTIKKLAASTDLSGKSDQEAAEQALALISQLGKHERLTRGHTERVRARAELIGAEMGLDEDELQRLRWGVMLHDVGKLTVPADILNKEAKLTDAEWDLMRRHPDEGARIVEPLRGWLGDWVDSAGEHHERWDGKGYPNGLSGTDISLAGRITAVADAYDVITSKRSYKDAMSEDAARQELLRCSGNQFDPAVVRAALQVGLREPTRLGAVGWLLEIPAVANVASTVPSAVGAAATSAVVVAGTLGGVVDDAEVPEAIAMVQPDSAARLEFLESEMPDEVEFVFPSTTLAPPEPAPETTEAPASTTTTTVAPQTTTTSAAPTSTETTAAPSTTTAAPTTTSSTTTTSTTVAPPVTTATPPTTAAPNLPSGTGFVLLAGDDVPNDLSNSSLESNDTAYLIEEKQSVTLTDSLRVVDFVQGREVVAAGNPTTTLPAGTVVCSWLVRFEVEEGASGRFTVTPQIDFGAEILGLSTGSDHLADSSFLAIDGVDYVPGEVGFTDRFTVSGSQLSLTLVTGRNGSIVGDGDGLDQLRVITAC